jgi:hypothetical protein
MATKKTETAINLPEFKIKQATITLQGTNPLIVHRFSEKARKEMLDKQMGVAKTKKDFKNPEQDYLDSLYTLEDGTPGFPAVAFKAAVVSSANDAGIQKVLARRAFHISGGELLPIKGEHRMREDMVRIGMGTADVRHRAEFLEWEVEVPVTYNASIISLEQLVNLFNIAGFGVGVGEWRPERNGINGTWLVTEVHG